MHRGRGYAKPHLVRALRRPNFPKNSDGRRQGLSADTKASGTLASRYARALLDLAADQGALAAVESDMAALGAMLEVSADLRALVRGGALARAPLGSAMQALGRKAGFHALSVNFLGVLAANGRLSSLYAVLGAFRRESAARRGVVDAKIETAFPLSTGQTRTLKEAIGKRLGASEVALDVSVNRALIGGVVLTVGSRRIDASVAARLDRLGQAMRAGT